MSLGVALQRWLVASYAYYVLDESVGMSDAEYDATARRLLEGWDGFEHRHKRLVTRADLEAGSLFGLKAEDYPGVVAGCAKTMVRAEEWARGSGIWD